MRRLLTALATGVVVAAIVATAGLGSAGQTTTINYATSFGSFGRDAYVYAAIEETDWTWWSGCSRQSPKSRWR